MERRLRREDKHERDRARSTGLHGMAFRRVAID